jgi:uncharacterized protein (TIGR03067 family)
MTHDIRNLQGTWHIVALELDGRKYPPAGSRIAIEGDRFESLNMGAEYSGTVVVDESANPRTLDLRFEKGPEQGHTSLGIYELDGDTWKICLGLTGKARPAAFVSAPGSGHALEVLRREPAGAGKTLPAADEHAAPVAELEGEWTMVSCLQDGQLLDPRFVKNATREFRGNTTTLTMGGQPFLKGRFTADPASGTVAYPDQRQRGIYRVSGDTLHTCLVVEGAAPPDGFTATPGDGRTVSQWQRKRPAGT